MSDYIERKSIRNLYSCLNPEDKVRVAQVLIDIDAIPSDDAVEVVRCKECKHWSGCKSTSHNNHLCSRAENVDYWTRADDYCSYGERKETDHE